MNYINERTDKTSPFTVFSNVTTQDTAYFVRKNLLEAWTTIEERWGGVFDADNWDIQFMTKIGNDNGETIMYGKDMTGISVYEDWSSVVTKLYPVGYNGLMLPEKFLESNIQYEIPYTKTIDFSTSLETEEQTEVNLLKELRRNALEYLDENKVPKVSYTVTANVNERLEMGDTVHVKHPLCNILTEVVEYVYNSISQKLKSITFGNYSRDVKAKFDIIKDNINKVAEKMTTQEIVIAKQTELINSLNKNGLIYIDENEILILDKLPREEAKNVWRFGLGGIGFSSNGYEGPFETAITMDGQINANFITTGTMNVARIEGLTDTLNDINVAIALNSNNIQATVDRQSDVEKNVSSLKLSLEEIKSQISNVTDVTTTLKGQSILRGIGINESEPILIKIRPVGYDITPLYPSDDLYPSNDLYPHSRELIFEQINLEEGKTGDYIKYDLPANLYYLNENVYDEFYMDYENQECYVIRRVGINSSGNKYEMSTPVITNFDYPLIALSGGDYEISMPAFPSAYMEIRLMLKNIYTSQFATQVQLGTLRTQTESTIKDEVNQVIKYADGEVEKLSARIESTVKSISLTVNNNDTTAGIVITLTNEDGSTKKLNGTISMTGLVKFNDLENNSNTIINGDYIKTGTISSNRIDTTNLRLGSSDVKTEMGAKSIDWLAGQVPSPSGRSSNPIAYFGAFNTGSMNKPRHSVGCEIWDNGDMYIRHIFTESGMDTEGYMGFIKTYLTTVDSLRAINYIAGVTSAGSRGININTYAESFDIYAATSDERLKENIVTSKVNALDIVNQIRLISFNWKDNGKYQALGFSAQQLKTVCEDFVSSVKQPDSAEFDEILQVRDFNIQPYMVGSIQELSKGCDELRQDVEKLKEENEGYKMVIEMLTKRIEELEKERRK